MTKYLKIIVALFILASFQPLSAQSGQGTFSRISSLFSGLFSSETTQYQSSQVTLDRPISEVYEKVSSFDNMGQFARKYVSSWQSNDTTCSFSIKGFSFTVRIAERVKNQYVKIVSESGCPVDFVMYIRLSKISSKKTLEYLDVSATMNRAIKAAFGSKAQGAVNWANERLVEVINN